MSKFFINRPIVAIVISILMVIVGAITIVSLPVSLFPAIAPPEVQYKPPLSEPMRKPSNSRSLRQSSSR
jgi:Cu/Ag efflux pump CusA